MTEERVKKERRGRHYRDMERERAREREIASRGTGRDSKGV